MKKRHDYKFARTRSIVLYFFSVRLIWDLVIFFFFAEHPKERKHFPLDKLFKTFVISFRINRGRFSDDKNKKDEKKNESERGPRIFLHSLKSLINEDEQSGRAELSLISNPAQWNYTAPEKRKTFTRAFRVFRIWKKIQFLIARTEI